MNVRIFIEMNQYAIEIRHNNQRLRRYTKIPDNMMGGDFIILEETEDKLVYRISPLYEKIDTENGYVHSFNIKLTNWLNYFVHKSIRSVLDSTELTINKVSTDFSRTLKESSEVRLK